MVLMPKSRWSPKRKNGCNLQHIEYEEKQLHATFPPQTMTKLTDVLKKENKSAEKRNICFKEEFNSDNRKIKDQCHYTDLYRGAALKKRNMKYHIPDHVPIEPHLFIKELLNKFYKDNSRNMFALISRSTLS